jgi:energy-coupling factor transporter transmembrane protein EcfT
MKDFAYSLMRLKIPYKYCFDFMVGIRYIPLIEREAKTIAMAQKARGFGRERANSIKKAYNLVFERLISTLVSVLRKTHITSISMENSCFGIYKKRTNLTQIKFKSRDIMFIIVICALFTFTFLYIFQVLSIPQFPSLYLIFKAIF